MYTPGPKQILTPVSNTLPDWVTVNSMEVDPSVPGELRIEVTVTWDSSNPQHVPSDGLFCLDGIIVMRTRGQSDIRGLIGGFVATQEGDTRKLGGRLDVNFPHHQWEDGEHLLVFRWLTTNGMTFAGEAVYPFTLGPVDTPAPHVVPNDIPLGMFSLSAFEFTAWTSNLQAVKDAGINYLVVGGFRAPYGGLAGGPGDPTWEANLLAVPYEQWEQGAEREVTDQLQFCKDHGMGAMIELDGLFRSAKDRWWWNNSPYRWQAFDRTRDLLMQFPEVPKLVRAVDEVEFVLGGDPYSVGVDPSEVYARWHAVPDAPPWSWPGQYGAEARAVYDHPGMRDFQFRYYRHPGIVNSSMAGPEGKWFSSNQLAEGKKLIYDSSRRDLPLAVLTGALIGRYKKVVDGLDYHPPEDELILGGNRPQDVATDVWLAILAGARAIQVYKWDMAADRNHRAGSPVGTVFGNMGVREVHEHWAWLTTSFKSVSVTARKHLLLTRTPHPFELKNAWATGGVRGLDVAINLSPLARPCDWIAGGVLLGRDGETPHTPTDLIPEGGVVLSV